MKNALKLVIRILITISVLFFIIFGIEQILKIKHRDKFKVSKSYEWTWKEENRNYFNLYSEKYEKEDGKSKYLVRMKNNEVPKKKDGEKRILVVGDSFIHGIGTTNINYTWWKQLNLRIKEAGYSNVNVYGAGYAGFSTKDELEKILNNNELIEYIDPDLIIIGYVPNDAEEMDENGAPVVSDDWDVIKTRSKLYKENPILYHELVDRLFALSDDNYDELVRLGEMLGGQRWDARTLYIVQGERLDRYRTILQNVDNRIKEIGVPYFYAFSTLFDNKIVQRSEDVMKEELSNMNIDWVDIPFNNDQILEKMNVTDHNYLNVNPADNGHPGIMMTYELSKVIYNKLEKNYSFIFENQQKVDMDNFKLNINDTMPFLELEQKNENVYEFEYPKKENEKIVGSKFLYYPIEKNYIKLNLEYPKNIKKIKITGENLEYAEVYVNSINEKYGFDYDEAFQKFTSCKYLISDTYEVNKKITSVNIYALFKTEEDRKLRIEFIE